MGVGSGDNAKGLTVIEKGGGRFAVLEIGEEGGSSRFTTAENKQRVNANYTGIGKKCAAT